MAQDPFWQTQEKLEYLVYFWKASVSNKLPFAWKGNELKPIALSGI